MSEKRIELALQKQLLQLQCQSQREVLAQKVAGMQPVFTAVDSGRAAVGWLKQRPLVGIAALAGLFVARPRRFVGLGMRAFSAWRMFKGVRARLGGLL